MAGVLVCQRAATFRGVVRPRQLLSQTVMGKTNGVCQRHHSVFPNLVALAERRVLRVVDDWVAKRQILSFDKLVLIVASWCAATMWQCVGRSTHDCWSTATTDPFAVSPRGHSARFMGIARGWGCGHSFTRGGEPSPSHAARRYGLPAVIVVKQGSVRGDMPDPPSKLAPLACACRRQRPRPGALGGKAPYPGSPEVS